MRHFFAPPPDSSGTISLDGVDARHLARVLRAQPGERITVADGLGGQWEAQLETVAAELVTARALKERPVQSEPAVRVTLLTAWSRAGKWEHVLQKAVELGAARITPFCTPRCLGSLPSDKLPRLQSIAREAAMQSKRGIIPEISPSMSFADAIGLAGAHDIALFCYEAEDQLSLREALDSTQPRSVAIVTGPEGGFSPEEVLLARQANCQIVSLGPRILRCETAPLAALTATLAFLGELDPQ